MLPADDGLPQTGPTPKTLGVRPGEEPGDGDITADENGMVHPYLGDEEEPEGMSVSPPPADNIVYFRRPPKHGGKAKKFELYELETDELPDELVAHRDPDPKKAERHVLICPAYEMSFEDYQAALESTRDLWRVF